MMSMQDIFSRVLENMVGRVHGPMNFRIIFQPLVAIYFAIRDGARDAREGRPAYFWSLLSGQANWRDLVKSGWKSVGKVFIVAFLLDAIYQVIDLKWFYPGEALLVALILAIVPYVLLRGPANRLTPPKRLLESHPRKGR
jgi:hypothetical protein